MPLGRNTDWSLVVAGHRRTCSSPTVGTSCGRADPESDCIFSLDI
jgi:hypothetical protein